MAESKPLFSCYTLLDEFIGRSKGGWFRVKRLPKILSERQVIQLKFFCDLYMGNLYHFGFMYKSNRQLCSKFVYGVYTMALGLEVGKLQTFKQLLASNPAPSRTFWWVWYSGFIPCKRLTVKPLSQF